MRSHLLHVAVRLDASWDSSPRALTDAWLAIGDEVGFRRLEFDKRFTELVEAFPDCPWPAETVVRQMGLVNAPCAAATSEWVRSGEKVVLLHCGCVFEAGSRIMQCDRHAEATPAQDEEP